MATKSLQIFKRQKQSETALLELKKYEEIIANLLRGIKFN